MRENTLIFSLFRETSGRGRSEISWSTGSVKNRLQLSMDAMGRENDFHDFLRAEELFWCDPHWGRGGEGTCLGRGSAVWGLKRLGSFKDFGKTQLVSAWDKGWGALCVCHGETVGFKPQLFFSPLARHRVGPTSTKLGNNLELSLYLSFSQTLYLDTGF